MCENVEARALLIADEHRHGVLEFFAEADVEHAGVEGTAPHADIQSARPGNRSGSGALQKQIGCCGEHGASKRHCNAGAEG